MSPEKENSASLITEDNVPDLAEALKALGHPSRLEIIRQLSQRDRCCTGDFCECLPLAQSTISQHLEMLRNCGLIETEASGTKTMITLNRAAISALSEQILLLSRNNCCDGQQT